MESNIASRIGLCSDVSMHRQSKAEARTDSSESRWKRPLSPENTCSLQSEESRRIRLGTAALVRGLSTARADFLSRRASCFDLDVIV